MLKWLKGVLTPRAIFDLTPAVGRCLPLRIRPYDKSDFEVMCGIYRRNEPGRFPQEYRDKFEQFIKGGRSLFLVVEDAGRVVGFGAVNLGWPGSPNIAWLSFGMVDPDLHRRGYGTTLLLARLAVLPTPEHGYTVCIGTVGSCDSFYTRFGFRQYERTADESGTYFNHCYVFLSPLHWQACHDLLRWAGTALEINGVVVPPASA